MGASIADSAFAGSTILLNTHLAAGRTLSSTWFTSHKPSKTRCEACWVLFRFLYWGQLADPCLIIHIDDVGWSVVSERFV